MEGIINDNVVDVEIDIIVDMEGIIDDNVIDVDIEGIVDDNIG